MKDIDSIDWGRITVYGPAMAAQVAAMFTSFDELWPGGFSGGVPYDERRVHDWLDDTTAIADLVALDAEGEPVGYCGVYPSWRDADAAYVTILGVVPRVKGQGYGKRLLLAAIEAVQRKGLRRLDLHTWSGNLNAVPLYKKVGMFWVPDTDVYMQDFLPGLFQVPLAREWFDAHPDWYGCQERELTQAQDKHIVDGMQLYTYVFQVGDDRLVAEVDRYAWGFCGMERTLDGETIAVKTRLGSHDILMGVPNAMTVTISRRNKAGQGPRDLAIALTVEPFKGLQWSEPFPLSLSVPEGEEVSVTREFVVDRSASAYKDDQASEAIKSRIILGGQVLEMVIGGKIRPAAEVSCRERYLVAPPGSQRTVYLDLTNHAKSEMRGRVVAFLEGQADGQQTFPFALGPEEVSGLQVPIAVPEGLLPPATALHSTAFVEVAGESRPMPVHKHPIVADAPDLACVVEETKGDRLNLLTDVLYITVLLEGGRVEIARRDRPGMRTRANLRLGPPWGIGPDETLRYQHEVDRHGSGITVILSAESRQFPGLWIRKHVRVAAGVREVEHWVTLTNLRASGPISVSGRLGTGTGFSLSLDPSTEWGRTFTPLVGGIVESDATLPWMDANVVPQAPESWAETWTAVQSLMHGDLDAWYWGPDHLAKLRADGGSLSRLETAARTLGPGESFEAFHVWHGMGLASLAEVRARWSQLVGHMDIPWSQRVFGPETRGPIVACLPEGNLLVAGENARRTVELSFATAYPLPGELEIIPPDGWNCRFVTPEGPKATIPMPEPDPETPSAIEVEVMAPSGAAGRAEVARLRHHGEFRTDLNLPLLVSGPGHVEVSERVLESKPVFHISNGALRFDVVDGVGGNLIRLEDAQGRSYLFDTFPEVAPRFFMEHHIGGIEPRTFVPHSNTSFGELEKVSVQVVQEGAWRGARATWRTEHQQELRGQEFGVSYLTLPGVGFVRIRFDHHNPTPRRLEWVGMLLLDVALEGSTDDMEMQAPGGTRVWRRSAAHRAFISPGNARESWGRISRGDQSLSMLSPEGGGGVVQLFDLQVLRGAFLGGMRQTGPGSRSSVEFALALGADEAEIAKLRKALASQLSRA